MRKIAMILVLMMASIAAFASGAAEDDGSVITIWHSNSGRIGAAFETLVDRFNVNWTSGDKVPVYAQKQGSLGRKVRGYASYSYNSELTIVNNLDLRFTSPALGVDGLYIRLNLFFDMGYGAGHFYNSEFRQNKFIASTGAQISFTIFDFIDLGYQLAYLIGGR